MNATPDPLRSAARAAAPSGTVTFAFTDIEGSTARWERSADAMRDAMRRHDALMRAAAARHGGYVFKTIGDAFCITFARPDHAAAAMVAAQRALAAEDFSAVDGIRVRAAIHTGSSDERDGDYFGPAVNRVARLLAIGHGGQILVSGATSALLAGTLPADMHLRDAGLHRLRDLALPERVHVLEAPGLAHIAAALKSLDALPNNLPLAANEFIGRETEIADITELLGRHRLVTLAGAGGIGKTRLALHVAAQQLDVWPDGAWLIELAPLSDGTYIASTIAGAMGLSPPEAGDATAQLVRQLAPKRALLLLDNCEHLIEPAARAVDALLRGCPDLSVLATSRQRLGITAEVTYRLPSLALPTNPGSAGPPLAASRAAEYAAIALFVERARAADNRFALTDDNAGAVADVCRRVDGLPLAIELAASRIRILSPRQLRERLDERFRILTGGRRDALPRQQTIRALIDWSHDLLAERERVLFRRLAIFCDGFGLDGALAAGGGPDLDEFEVFDALASLVDQSLVLTEPAGDEQRYRLLESTRAYAGEKLAAAGERDAVTLRHCRYLRQRFATLRTRVDATARHSEIEALLRAEREDVRFALAAATARADAVSGAELLAAAGTAWFGAGLLHEGIARIEKQRALLAGESALLDARLATALANLLRFAGDWDRSLAVSIEAVDGARTTADADALAAALVAHAVAAAHAKRFDAADAAVDEAEKLGGSTALRLAVYDLRAQLSYARGDLATTARMRALVCDEYRALGETRRVRYGELLLAVTEHLRGESRHALDLLQELVPAARAGDDAHLLFGVLSLTADVLLARGDARAAEAPGREMFTLLARLVPPGSDWRDDPIAVLNVALAIELLAGVHAGCGELERAATLAGYSAAALGARGHQRDRREQLIRDRLDAQLQRLAPAERERLAAAGAVLDAADGAALALA